MCDNLQWRWESGDDYPFTQIQMQSRAEKVLI